MDKSELIWTFLIILINFNLFRQVLAILNKFEPFWTSFNQYKQVSTCMNLLQPVLTNLEQFAIFKTIIEGPGKKKFLEWAEQGFGS